MFKKVNFDFITAPQLKIDGFMSQIRENGDFWRMHLDYCESGMNNELGVYSHQQNVPEIKRTDNEIIFIYNEIIAEDNSKHNIKLELKITQINETLDFAATITNNSCVRVNELQYPLFEFERINEPLERDELFLPMGLGRKVDNLHEYVNQAHTEYMAAEYKNIWCNHTYPGQMSMPWMGIQSGDKYLYIGWHSQKMHLFNLTIGTEPRGSSEKYIILTASSYPAVKPGETITSEGFVFAAFQGDWRDGVDFYRSWADKEWHTNVNKNDSVKNIHGWQRIILKHQYGEIFHTYDELPQLYDEGAKCGLNMILLFAWWKEGMDNGYPNYMPDPALGGAEKLKAAIKEINAKGGYVVLYANGHLIDASTEYYKTEGFRYTMKNIEKIEYRDSYQFSNNGTLIRFSGHKTFVAGCYGTPQWREKMIEIEKRHLELGSNGTFFDQLAICFALCFDETHEHGSRIDLDPQLRMDTVIKMRQLLTGDNEYFGTEWTVDRLAHQMDFIHGCGWAYGYSGDTGAYPYIFRYAFPDILISNRGIHDERDDWKRELNYAFTFGLIYDVAIYRCRAKSIFDTPNYAEYIKKCVSIREKYLDFFTKGKTNLPSISLPVNIKAMEYCFDNKKIITLWNDSGEAVEVCGKKIPSQGIDVIEVQ